jgi:hypothetical protein
VHFTPVFAWFEKFSCWHGNDWGHVVLSGTEEQSAAAIKNFREEAFHVPSVNNKQQAPQVLRRASSVALRLRSETKAWPDR